MKKVEIISSCPICASKLERVNNQLFCRNISCAAKNFKQVQAFAKKMKIMGLGEKTVEKLGLSGIRELYEITEDLLIKGIGEKLGRKLYFEIEGSRNTNIAVFLSSLSIPLIGSTAAGKIASLIKNIDEINIEKCKEAGLGPKASTNLSEWVINEWPNYKDLDLTFESVKVPSIKTKHNVCVTGKIEGYTRDSIRVYLGSLGVKVTNSVTKNTEILICNDKTSSSSKVKKAGELNIEINTFDEFKEKLYD